MQELIEIIIAEDKELFRKILVDILEPFDIKVVAQAENGKELLEHLKTKKNRIVLLDLDMPVMDGNEAFNIIGKHYPETRVIILSLHFEPVLVENYIERGAKGYLPKDAIMDNELLLINAIYKVKDGGVFIYEKPQGKEKFTKKQVEMMPLIFEGLTNDAIADEMGVSKRSVEKQRQKLYKKSGAEKIIDFYKYAFSRGLQFLGKRPGMK